jgi:restriction system protein
MKVWCVRAEFGKYADIFKQDGYVAIDYEIEKKLPIGRPKQEYSDLFKTYHPDEESNIVIGQQVGQITRFLNEIEPRDYIITPSSDTDVLFYGVVLDEPYYFEDTPEDGCPYRHRRKVNWFDETASRSSFSVPFQNTCRSSLTVFKISQSSEFLTSIKAEGFEPDTEQLPLDPYESVLERVLSLNDKEFEHLAKHLLSAIGFEESEVTGKVGDGGVDVTGTLNVYNIAKMKIHVQAKRIKKDSRISANTVKQLRSAIPTNGQGAFITTADFQKKSHEIANEQNFPRIGLINGKQLVDLLIEHWEDIPEEYREKLGLKRGLVLS